MDFGLGSAFFLHLRCVTQCVAIIFQIGITDGEVVFARFQEKIRQIAQEFEE